MSRNGGITAVFVGDDHLGEFGFPRIDAVRVGGVIEFFVRRIGLPDSRLRDLKYRCAHRAKITDAGDFKFHRDRVTDAYAGGGRFGCHLKCANAPVKLTGALSGRGFTSTLIEFVVSSCVV